MAHLFKKILCPVDFDGNSMKALDFAADLAHEHQAMLYILHVVRAPIQPSEVPVQPPIPEWKADAKAQLDAVVRPHVDGKAQCALVLKSGDPFAGIMEAEQELKPDSLVMATHGRTGVGHILMGSVAERVVRESICPVVTLRPHASGA